MVMGEDVSNLVDYLETLKVSLINCSQRKRNLYRGIEGLEESVYTNLVSTTVIYLKVGPLDRVI